MFTKGAIGVGDDLKLWGIEGVVHRKIEHPIDRQSLAYHRNLYAVPPEKAQSLATDIPRTAPAASRASPLMVALSRIQQAVENAQNHEVKLAAEALKKTLDESTPEKIQRIVDVLKVMGQVGDVANMPKIFNLLIAEMKTAGILRAKS